MIRLKYLFKALRLALGILLTSTNVYSQEYEFDIHGRKISDFVSAEAKLGSTHNKDIANHLLPAAIAQPIVFIRKQGIISDLEVQYFYFKKDSTIHYILYEWDDSRDRKLQHNQPKPESYQRALIEKYNSITRMIEARYGESKSEGVLDDLSKTHKKDGGLKKKDIWSPNDSTEIETYIVISNYYKKQGSIIYSPTHRIRMYVRTNKGLDESTSKVSTPKTDSLDGVAQKLFHSLSVEDFASSKEYLSELIINKITNEQLDSLSNSFDFKRKLGLFLNGFQMRLDGSRFSVLQYKYLDDTNTPPKELLKIMFDDKGKVVGIQPMRRN